MKNEGGRSRHMLWIVLAVVLVIFIIIPLSISLLSGSELGNVALIPLEGVLTSDGRSFHGSATTPSSEMVQFIKEADENPLVKVIVLQINCPGGSPVATDEIAQAVSKATKPVIAQIREVAASGCYWVASAADHIIANSMSMTGSIGVYSSYLEFSGLMDKYGVGYEQINAGIYKDIGIPYRKLEPDEKGLMQQKANTLHQIFIKTVARNRGLEEIQVRKLSTGEIFLGSEALEKGLVDQLGNQDTLDEYIKEKYQLDAIEYVRYEREPGFFDIFSGSLTDFGTNIGKGIGSVLLSSQTSGQPFMLVS